MSEECKLCGEPMPQGEKMFNFHGFSGPCPKPPKAVVSKPVDMAVVMLLATEMLSTLEAPIRGTPSVKIRNYENALRITTEAIKHVILKAREEVPR